MAGPNVSHVHTGSGIHVENVVEGGVGQGINLANLAEAVRQRIEDKVAEKEAAQGILAFLSWSFNMH